MTLQSPPACFASPTQYARWSATAKQTGLPRSGYCADCTPDYQRAMRSARRCGYPGTAFGRDADGMVVGRRRKDARTWQPGSAQR